MWNEEVLVDKTIVGVKVKSPSVWLQVKEGGWIEIKVKGDCCSEAFIDSIMLHDSPKLTGELVEIYFPSQSTSQEVDDITAVRFLGYEGSFSILHRNSSNGYYGNYLSINSRGEPPEDAEDGRCWFREVRSSSDQSLIEQKDALLNRALAIINDAILHGMPVTEEVAEVSNLIRGVKK